MAHGQKKAAAIDNNRQHLKHGMHANEILLSFCNSVYNKEQFKSWTEGCILPFLKKKERITEGLHSPLLQEKSISPFFSIEFNQR